MYSDNDIRLYHSAKGSTWKNHKYISKTGVGESARYKYSVKDTVEAVGDKIDDIGDKVYDGLGYRDREQYRYWKNVADRDQQNYELAKKTSDGLAGDSWLEYNMYKSELSQETFNRVTQQYYNTPIGSVEKYVNAGKEAISAFNNYLDQYKKK